MTTDKCSKQYRTRLGFSNQDRVKEFLGAKDIVPAIDYGYINDLNKRLVEIVKKLNSVVVPEIQPDDIDDFCQENIFNVFKIMKDNDIISRLNNQGRRPEQVYFSWLRGFLVCKYFQNALSIIFEVDVEFIELNGGDDLSNIEDFSRTPNADFLIHCTNNEKIFVEVQSGFNKYSDIKEHKIKQALKMRVEDGIQTILIHFDLYNGQVAFVNLSQIQLDNKNFKHRAQMEGQRVFEIPKMNFVWRLFDYPITYKEFKDLPV